MSARQRSEIEEFRQSFPSIGDVYRFFSPSMWGYVQSHKEECATRPCITISQVDDVYGVVGGARWIVKEQITGIYSLGMNREPMNTKAQDLAADLFVSRYGSSTLYALMVYFSGYLTDYKSSYASYDVQDILQQFGKKFLPQWRTKTGVPVERVKSDAGRPVGREALLLYLRKKAESGEDLRSGGLYEFGYVTEDTIREVEQQLRDGIF